MKRAAAPAPASPQRTIGEILLEHGYVTGEDLDAAIQRQEETGFPLGQILVEAGAITRLELASALAVQWADVTPARPSSDERKGKQRSESKRETQNAFEEQLFAYAAPPPDDAWRDEVRNAARAFAQRLDAVEVALDELREEAETETTPEDAVDIEGAIAPLTGRIDEAIDRVAALDAALGEYRGRQEATAEGLEALREELSRRAGAVTAALEALSAQVEHSAPTAALDELRSALEALAARPAADESLSGAVAQLAARVEGVAGQVDALADPTALDELRRALDSLADQPASDPVLAGRLDELAARLDELAARPASDPVMAERLEELAAAQEELAQRPAGDPAAGARLDELAARIEGLADPTALEELRRALDSVAERPTSDPVLAGRLEELGERLEELSERQAADPELGARVDELAARYAALAELNGDTPMAAGSEALAAQVGELGEAAGALTHRIEEAVQTWATERDALEHRLTALAERLDREPIPMSDGAAAGDPSDTSEQDLDRLRFAVERLSLQLTEHHRTLDMLMGADGSAGSDPRLDALLARLEAIEAGAGRPAAAAGAPSASPSGDGAVLNADLHELARKVAQLDEASRSDREKLLTQIEQMMSSIDWRFQRLESGGKAA